MSNTKNSLSTLMSQFIRLNRNALEIFQRLNEAITTSRESVTVELFDDSDKLKSIQVPSFGHLLKRITDAENNIKNLTAVGDTDVKFGISSEVSDIFSLVSITLLYDVCLGLLVLETLNLVC